MATILSSKVIEVADRELTNIANELTNWLYGFKGEERGCRITVTLEQPNEGRQQKKVTAKKRLDDLIVDAIAENPAFKTKWKNGFYEFRFIERKYLWRGKEVYITAGEALFLFQWLVLSENVSKLQWYYLQNMRRRLGRDFLREVSA